MSMPYTVRDAQRFREWFEKPGQCVSDWDKGCYARALEILENDAPVPLETK